VEKAAIDRFFDLLVRHQLIEFGGDDLRFV
jgi:hypothetical protein